MYHFDVHDQILAACGKAGLADPSDSTFFYTRFSANAGAIRNLYQELYASHPGNDTGWNALISILIHAHQQRSADLRKRDTEKMRSGNWFLSNQLSGMSLYVDRFCGKLNDLPGKLPYLQELGVNLLHLMPIFESPASESDGGYAVSDFRKVDDRFGTLAELQSLQQTMQEKGMYLMTDIVLNHTSRQHAWARKALEGDKDYQSFYYFYDDRTIPDLMEASMPEIFPESSPGSFSYVRELGKWVMTVFHDYQWDLNYTNPAVFNAMLDTIFFYANLGVDILRIDAPAFIWKEAGTTCQNLPKAHTILRLIKLCVQVAAPGMALLGEAIVAPKEIMQYFGTDLYSGRECDFAYNATQMALQWDALATADTRVMLAAQSDLLQKPDGSSWINYTRCHDDIGLGFEDASIASAGFDPYAHRAFLKNYYAGIYQDSPATGALFSVNPKTQDARISGSLASLCGLEKAIEDNNREAINRSLNKIILMQAQTCFLGGLPMLFYGDEVGYTNDYSYLEDPGKSYDNRWMHRPVINWQKNERRKQEGTTEAILFQATARLLRIRSRLPILADHSNIHWLKAYNIHVAGFLRTLGDQKLYCLFNYSERPAYLTWYAFKEHGKAPKRLFDHWSERRYVVGEDYEYFILEPYAFHILEVME